MKLVVLSLIFLGLGFWLQREFRPATEELEVRASLAWNAGNLKQAEQDARTAYGRTPEAVRAREILLRLSDAWKRPELHLAILLRENTSSQSRDRTWNELGRVALSANWFRVADDYFAEGVRQFPENEALWRQYVALSGLRLDADQMQARLLEWSRHGTPSLDLVMMSLGLWSLDTRGATPSETWLKAAVEADATDRDSRIGLARSLMAMGRYTESITLLQAGQESSEIRCLLALAHATIKDLPQAEAMVGSSEPPVMQADYWFTKGLIAIESNDLPAAEIALKNAVNHRPLNQTYRSRYCEVLRRLNRTEELARHARELDAVTRIVQQSKQPQEATTAQSVSDLAQLCQSVGADAAATLLLQAAGRK